MYQQFDYLPEDAKKIRIEVFMEEQHFEDEFDDIDSTATHLVFYDGLIPYGVCRYYNDAKETEYLLGRIAITKDYRKKHLGNHIVQIAEQLIKERGGTKISLSAQLRAKGFYEKLGFTAVGAPYLDEYCEHIHMEKQL